MSLQKRPTKALMLRRLYVAVAVGAVVSLTAAPAHAGTRTRTTGNKDNSRWTIDSIHFRVDQDATITVTGGGGGPWTVTPVPGSNRQYVATGGTVTPGNSATVTATMPGAPVPGVRILAVDYQGVNGWFFGRCPDPVSHIAVAGGETGTDYLGYEIPPNEYGYFYQVWNEADFPDETLTTTIDVGTNSSAYNFQILDNTFEIDPIPGFDLGDIERPLDPNDTYWVQHYMDPQDALGVPGEDMTWDFDGATGLATMTFLPGRSGVGLGPSETGSIVAFTSPYEPILTDEANISSEFASGGGCPEGTAEFNFVYVPTPEPATLSLLALGALTFLLRRKAQC